MGVHRPKPPESSVPQMMSGVHPLKRFRPLLMGWAWALTTRLCPVLTAPPAVTSLSLMPRRGRWRAVGGPGPPVSCSSPEEGPWDVEAGEGVSGNWGPEHRSRVTSDSRWERRKGRSSRTCVHRLGGGSVRSVESTGGSRGPSRSTSLPGCRVRTGRAPGHPSGRPKTSGPGYVGEEVGFVRLRWGHSFYRIEWKGLSGP